MPAASNCTAFYRSFLFLSLSLSLSLSLPLPQIQGVSTRIEENFERYIFHIRLKINFDNRTFMRLDETLVSYVLLDTLVTKMIHRQQFEGNDSITPRLI